MSNKDCPVCHSTQQKKTHQLFDDRFGFKGDFTLFKCLKCNHRYLEQTFNQEQLNKLYIDYYPRKNIEPTSIHAVKADSNFKNWLTGRHSRVCFWVPKNVKILDVGCGFGETLLYHKQRGCMAYGLEVDRNVEPIAKYHQLNINTNTFIPDDYEQNYFDFITMDQVIEHVLEPKEMLISLSTILAKDGAIILSTPNAETLAAKIFGKKWINWHAPYHLHFFSKQSMQDLIADSDLEIIKYKQITSSEWLFYQFMHLLTYPRQGEKSLFWLNLPLKKKRHVFIRRTLNILKRLKIFDLITRFFDIMGMGDNQIFILKKKLSTVD